VIVEDEHGWRWAIHNGDPAAALVTRLARLGFRHIVLPQLTLIGGSLTTGPSVDDLTQDADTYRSLEPIVDDATRKRLADALLRRMALHDICAAAARVDIC
jgi:hypothetical protein